MPCGPYNVRYAVIIAGISVRFAEMITRISLARFAHALECRSRYVMIAGRGRRARSAVLSLTLRRRGSLSLPHRRIDLCITEAVRGIEHLVVRGAVDVRQHRLYRERRMFPSVSPAPRSHASCDDTSPCPA